MNTPAKGTARLYPNAVESVNGATVIAETLCELEVKTVFCYPGGANLEILDAISRVDVELIRTEHEQGAVFAAQGYARATGRLGVCLATSGPGATNLVTGIADANSDSVPVLAITGNVATRWLGRNAFQEVDIVAVTKPITKLATQVREVQEVGPALLNAAALAMERRPGPVLVDFPKDIQQRTTLRPARRCCRVDREVLSIGPEALETISLLIRNCSRPVIYAGGGVIASDSAGLLARLANKLHCPVTLTLMGLGALPPNHPLLLGPLGMHGAWCANVAVNEADLVLALGVRFDDRVIGDPQAFAQSATIVHIDIDATELGKNKPTQVAVQADLRAALLQLIEIAQPIECRAWIDYLRSVSTQHPLEVQPATKLTGPGAIAALASRVPPDSVVTMGVGQHQMWAMQLLRPAAPRSFLSSSGFGTMGFGLPAAIGAKTARPKCTVIDIDGDGSLNMTVNELNTCRRHGIGVKVFVVNNQWLGMVRQWQDLIYSGNRVVSSFTGPDFAAIARGYGVLGERVSSSAQLQAAIERLLADPDEPYLLDVLVERESNVFPMIPSGKSYKDVIFEARQGRLADT